MIIMMIKKKCSIDLSFIPFFSQFIHFSIRLHIVEICCSADITFVLIHIHSISKAVSWVDVNDIIEILQKMESQCVAAAAKKFFLRIILVWMTKQQRFIIISSKDLISNENKFIVMVPSIFLWINTWL